MNSKKLAGMLFVLAWLCGVLFSDAAQAASKVTLEVVDGQVRDVLVALSRLGGKNLLIDDSVCGKVTLQLREVDFDEALRLICSAKGLERRQSGDVLLIGAAVPFERAFGAFHVFKLHYITPDTARAAAETALGAARPIAAKRSARKKEIGEKENLVAENPQKIDYNESKRFFTDAAADTLVFFGSSAEAKRLEDLFAVLDVPCGQVSLEAKVVAIEKEAAKNLGVEWEWSKLPQYPKYEESGETSSGKTARQWLEDEAGGGVIRFGHGPEGYPFEFYYAAKLNALLTSGKAEILARPNITTLAGREAVINIGGEVPIPKSVVTQSTTTTSIEYREAGIILRYTPRINADGWITADVHTEVSSPVFVPDVKAYRFNKRSAHTSVRLKTGETMVIGGLIGSEESRSVAKIPFLGDLPILGRFFENVKNTKSSSEVMIFLTANIIE